MNLVLFSGGIDSTTALFWSLQNSPTQAVIFAYPSRHNAQEVKHALHICKNHAITHHVLDLHQLFLHFKSTLLGQGDIPHGTYTDKNIKDLIIPFRNGIFLSAASGLAQSIGAEAVILANHAGDHPLYPDCSLDFIEKMNAAIVSGTNKSVRILSPFCTLDKADIVKIGLNLGIDYQQTYSCYEGGIRHCNLCPTCLESLDAFKRNGITIKR